MIKEATGALNNYFSTRVVSLEKRLDEEAIHFGPIQNIAQTFVCLNHCKLMLCYVSEVWILSQRGVV